MKQLLTLAAILIISGLSLLNAQIDFVKVKSSSDMDTVWDGF